jgi:hypothetical protein
MPVRQLGVLRVYFAVARRDFLSTVRPFSPAYLVRAISAALYLSVYNRLGCRD